MTTLTFETEIRSLAPVGSGKATDVSSDTVHVVVGNAIYVVRRWAGPGYVLGSSDDVVEESPEARLGTLIELARREEEAFPYRPDSPEEEREGAETISALYALQAEAMEAPDEAEEQ